MSEAYNVTEIWIEKSNVANTKIVEKEFNSAQLGADEVLLKIDSFGFSANNVTYSVFGDKMGYWGFFPADDSWGIVPMWGFATVQESKSTDVKVGEKVYGYYQVAREAWQLNYRPLFMTSFVLDDYVGEGLVASEQPVTQVILTSASSKTAYGAAHLLMKHKAERGLNYQVIGLTSASNKAFTQDLDCYEQVLSYDEIAELGQDNTSWVLDFAGNKSLLLNLQKQFSDNLDKLVLIGSTDVDAQQDKPDGHLDSEFFFAPSQVKKRSGEWGHAGFAERYAKAWQSFAVHMNDKVSVAEYSGAKAIEALYHTGLENKLNNLEINVLTFQ